LIERYFKLAEYQTTLRRELFGGLTTFMTMAYILVVNPQILAQAGMPADGVLFATCISSAAASLVMGLYANYPIALAPGMSLNAYFTYSVCLGLHIPWQTALGVVFFSGVLFRLRRGLACSSLLSGCAAQSSWWRIPRRSSASEISPTRKSRPLALAWCLR
jgi:AGZA family xanthine/uracil permease-like MFS transporter